MLYIYLLICAYPCINKVLLLWFKTDLMLCLFYKFCFS